MRVLYDFTDGHLWGFLKRDLVRLMKDSSLEIEDIYYLNVQPMVPLELKGARVRRIFRKIVESVNK